LHRGTLTDGIDLPGYQLLETLDVVLLDGNGVLKRSHAERIQTRLLLQFLCAVSGNERSQRGEGDEAGSQESHHDQTRAPCCQHAFGLELVPARMSNLARVHDHDRLRCPRMPEEIGQKRPHGKTELLARTL
jgi:hypothetical protein